MAEQEKVELRAFALINDPVAGQVEAGEDFETYPQFAEYYHKVNAAGPAGTDAREIQLEIAAEELGERAKAKRSASEGRKIFRNLSAGSVERGNTAAVGVIPESVGAVDAEDQRTNSQTIGSPDKSEAANTVQDDSASSEAKASKKK